MYRFIKVYVSLTSVNKLCKKYMKKINVSEDV